MLLRRFLLHIKSENWFAVLVDFVVVVLGLFIGLQIDTWWEERRESRLEAAYQLEIKEDFEQNQARLEVTISELERTIHSMITLLQEAAKPTPDLPAAELNDHFRLIGNMPTFIPVNRAYSNLTGSGDLKLIESRELKNILASYYAAAQLTMLVQNTHEMELVQIYEPYIIENLDFAAVNSNWVDDISLPPPLEPEAILDVMGTRQFRNVLTQKWVISTDLLDQHRGMMKRTEDTLRILQLLQSGLDQKSAAVTHRS